MKSLVLALFLGAVTPQELFDYTGLTEAEAFVQGWKQAMKDVDLNATEDLILEPHAEPGFFWDYTVNTLDIKEDMTQLWNDQTCQGGVNRWGQHSNSLAAFKQVLSQNGKYVDSTFGTDSSSLYWGQMGVLDVGTVKNMQAKIKAWKRPSEIHPNQDTVLYGELGHPAPTGIQQGQIGDCWFLASLAALAEEPDRIETLIANKHYSDQGIFRFRFYNMGQWHSINIDDQLPVMEWGQGWHTFATSRSRMGAWWVPLFEKAFAKYNQNYERIEAGLGYEGLKVLTGLPVKYYNFKELDEQTAWSRFNDYHDINFPMTTPCCRESQPYGIVSGHAYTFLGTVQLSNGVKLAHVRNPWAVEKYNGPYSDSSNDWTPQLLKEAGHTLANDGKYFLPFDIYFKYFYFLSVAYTQQYGQITPFENVHMTEKYARWRLDVPEDQELFVTTEHANPRNYPRRRDCYTNPFINTYLIKEGERNPMFGIGIVMNNLYHNSQGQWGTKLPAGSYTFQVINWGYDKGQRNVDVGVQVHATQGGVKFYRI